MNKPRGPHKGKPPGLPDKQRILDFIRESPSRVGRREIARAFSIKGAERIQLKSLLKELKQEGLIEAERRHAGGAHRAKPGALPSVGVLEVLGPDPDGEVLARPMQWHGSGPPPRVYVVPERGHPALGRGDRVLARLARIADGYEARVIRHIGAGVAARRAVGVFRRSPRPGEGGRIHPTDRRVKSDYHVDGRDTGGAENGELVLAELLPPRRMGLPTARVVERIG
ncbi:MAG: ribonuclease R, partial [Rhodospirillales bacterium]